MEDKIKQLEKEIEKLKADISLLGERRIRQTMIEPFAIKQRAMGEPNKYINGSVTADKPTTGGEVTFGSEVFYDYTAKKLYIWNSENDDWDEVAFS